MTTQATGFGHERQRASVLHDDHSRVVRRPYDHIHLRVRSRYSQASSTSDGTNTTQVFVDQTFIDRLATSVAPYSAEGKNPTTNATDRVFSEQTSGANVLSLSGDDTNGYAAVLTIVLPITSTGTGSQDGGDSSGPDGGMDGSPGGSPGSSG
jgi:hypothetical protein